MDCNSDNLMGQYGYKYVDMKDTNGCGAKDSKRKWRGTKQKQKQNTKQNYFFFCRQKMMDTK